MTLHPESNEDARAKWEKQKAESVEAIDQLEHELAEINNLLKTTPSHLEWAALPSAEKFKRLAPSRKQLVDTAVIPGHMSSPHLGSPILTATASPVTLSEEEGG